MRILTQRFTLSMRLALVSLVFMVPTVVMLFFIVRGINSNIEFSRLETCGNEYQRLLEVLLELLPEHRWMARHQAADKSAAADRIKSLQARIDEAFANLIELDARIGVDLQFTEVGLGKRQREHVRVGTVHKEWQDLKQHWTSLAPSALAEQHAHLLSDVGTMITHVGDTSNLILDPDLDSYYLMDTTLLALPQTQQRLAAMLAWGETTLNQDALRPEDQVQFAVHASSLEEADLNRILASAQTALNEDQNFHGSSPTLRKNLEPALAEYKAATMHLVELVRKLAGVEKPGSAAAGEYFVAGQAARAASFKLWQTAVAELDGLLMRRIRDHQRGRSVTLGLSLLAVGMAWVLSYFIARGISRPLLRTAETLGDGSKQIAAAAVQISSASQTLAEGASEQAASLEETSASLEEMSSMTRRNAENAQQANTLASQTRAAADTGAKDMAEMTRAMQDIKSSSDDIAKIIKTIDEIAFQTNILALNAAVEAARAGEAGMGFAVVADEVRNLAQRSAQAAKETAAKIEGAIAKTSHGVTISSKVAANLTEIVDKARQVDTLAAEVATASREQSQGITQVNTAVSQMDKVTQTNAASAEESASAAEELNGQAAALKHAVDDLLSLVGQEAHKATPASREPSAASGQGSAEASSPRSNSPQPAVSAPLAAAGKANSNGVAKTGTPAGEAAFKDF